jgi:3-deoxy-D-manno-octulosonic acid kinase
MCDIMEHILRFGPLAVLHDPERLAAPVPGWFDPEWWQARDAIRARYGGRGEALGVDGPAGPAVLRRYLRGGMVRHFNRSRYLYTGLERTRPWREWQLTRELWLAGLPVPQPLAAAVERHGPFYQGALLTARIEGARPLSKAAAELGTADWRRLGALLAEFAEAGLVHPDLNAGNILLDPEEAFWLIDFDRATLGDQPGPKQAMLKRLLRSLDKLGCRHDEAALRRGMG